MTRKDTFVLLLPLGLLFVSLGAHAQNWSGILAPARAIDWSSATSGAGPIPDRTTICSSLTSNTTTSAINTAIANCSSSGGGVVSLAAGTYSLNGAIVFAGSNVTLRGAGADQTKLVFTSGSGCGNTTSVVCVGTDGNWSGGPDHSTAWTAGYSQGTTVVTLGSVSGLSVGQVLILDQADDSSDPGNIYVCGTTSCSSEGQAGGGGRGGNRAQLQYGLVTNINGTNVTISPGLYMPNWRSSQTPGAWWATTLAKSDGIESLMLDNRTAGAGSITVFNNAYKCWMKGVASVGGGSRSHVDFQYSPNITVRDSYFWGSNGANLSYGIEPWMAGNDLVENNIFQHVTTPMLNGDNEGTVYGYNYTIDSYTNNSSWLYPSAMNHDPGTAMNLFEGNVMPSAMQDTIHGTHNMETYFRNRLQGIDPANSQTSQTVPLLLSSYSRYTNFVGNVLGMSGYHNNYEAAYGTTGSGSCNTSIFNLGWGGTTCGTGVGDDSITVTTVMRWGNYDTVNGTVRWAAGENANGAPVYPGLAGPSQTLPASFYYSAQPSWWPSGKPWPPIGPDVTGGNISSVGGHAYTIPAEDCYVTVMGGPVTSGGGVLSFNADACYSTGAGTPPAPPSNLNAIVQ